MYTSYLLRCRARYYSRFYNKKDMQSFFGNLLCISKCVKNICIFLNHMLDPFCSHNNTDKIILDTNFHRDLNWFCKFLPKFDGKAFFQHSPIQATIELACLQGLGAVCMNQVYAIKIPVHLENCWIIHLEMFNIIFVTIRTWKAFWQNKRILTKM